MRVISNRALLAFTEAHPDAGESLQVWRKVMETRDFANHAELKRTFGSVDKAGDFHVFDVGGNKWRVIAFVHFPARICYVKHVLTHKEYDKWRP
ncbi:MAG: type II toxin-antitoxin system HigB family toxin [Thermomonas sp.]|uniref:type II toxin-antitoxin system HigB family toxin n=1 Tax=Thermomonas sp. TaxID=1971895 RepID=UPI0039E51F48